MKKRNHSLLSLLLIAFITVSTIACSSDKPKNTSNDTNEKRTIAFTDSLAFISTDGDTVATISIAIADDQKERAQGLMNYPNLGQNEGMLFIFKKEQPLSFWMANTPISLDIIFVDKNNKIIRIHHSTPPYSQENFRSGEPALYAVETNGGFTIAHDIREGMSIKF